MRQCLIVPAPVKGASKLACFAWRKRHP
jgi:hypothetical protein